MMASVGESTAGVALGLAEGWDATGPITVAPDVWEFRALVLTIDTRPQREELEFSSDSALGDRQVPESRHQVGTVAIGISLASVRAIRHRIFIAAAFLTALVACLAVLSAVLLAKAITRHLRVLARAADAIAQGELNATVEIRTHDEVGALADSFNAMARSLARSRATLEEHHRTLEEKVRARTERLEIMNRELEEASYLKSEFLATVSHELRTPLNVIMGYCSMLVEGAGGPVTSDQHEMLDAVQRYSKLQLDLITSVLDFSRLTSGKVSLRVERFALAPLLADIQALHDDHFARSAVRFTVTVAPDVPELETDRVKLQEIVRNLVDNAVKFTEAGAISIKACADGGPESVVIEVCDTGPGIAPDELRYVFDAFRQVGQSSTRRTAGVGLGLSIVRQLVNALGGTVSVASRLGEGSTFRIEIPSRLRSAAVPAPIEDGGSPRPAPAISGDQAATPVDEARVPPR
jgi:signal transduction histidine kinase